MHYEIYTLSYIHTVYAACVLVDFQKYILII